MIKADVAGLVHWKGMMPPRNAFNPNDWNHFRIIAIGPYIKTWINGIPAADIIDYESANGFIALQLHLVHNDGAKCCSPGSTDTVEKYQDKISRLIA